MKLAMLFCRSKRRVAGGLPTADIDFPATAVGPIVLPLMLFRQMQSMVCAALARRYGQRAGQAVPIVAERA